MRKMTKKLERQCDIRLNINLKKTLGLKGCPVIQRSADVAAIFKGVLRVKREVMIAGALDSKCRLIRWSLVAIGSNNSVNIRTGDVFLDAIRSGAMGIVLVHNHPSGSLEPSNEDRELTRHVKEAGCLLGYPLLDHVIVANSGFRSLMPERIEKLCPSLSDPPNSTAAKRDLRRLRRSMKPKHRLD
jgi:DNA repair protein RadC